MKRECHVLLSAYAASYARSRHRPRRNVGLKSAHGNDGSKEAARGRGRSVPPVDSSTSERCPLAVVRSTALFAWREVCAPFDEALDGVVADEAQRIHGGGTASGFTCLASPSRTHRADAVPPPRGKERLYSGRIPPLINNRCAAVVTTAGLGAVCLRRVRGPLPALEARTLAPQCR